MYDFTSPVLLTALPTDEARSSPLMAHCAESLQFKLLLIIVNRYLIIFFPRSTLPAGSV
jgi:hypothetical protein